MERRAIVDGAPRDSVSGHAVLATHVREGSRRAGNGYWLDRRQIECFEAGEQPDLFDGDYPVHIPELLDHEMTAIATTGAVVCIVGFNRFRGEVRNVVREIRRVAATNFLAAIEHGEMAVRIADESADTVCDVNRKSLSEDLLEFERQRRSQRGSGGGWLVGGQAHSAWTTLREGDRLRGVGDGVGVRIRRLDADGAARGSRVNVFRTGMWVTNGAKHLEPSDFTRQNPFDAVVLLSGEGELCRLVRDAEGPEHRTIEEKRLELSDRERLFELFREIADRLRAEAGDVSTEEPWQPEDFAVFRGAVLRGAEQLRPYRPRASGGEEAVVIPKPGPEPGPRPNPDSEPNPRRPKPGRGVKARIAHRLLPGTAGFDRLVVRLKVEDGKLGRPGAQLGLRVRRDSGSDESCSSPEPPEWLPLLSAEDGRGSPVGRSNGPKELIVPVPETDLIVRLAEPVGDPRGLQVDVVHRQPDRAATEG